jgi:hypothetical protein
MLVLGSIQIGKHHHRQSLPGGLTQQPKCEGVGDPAAHLLMVADRVAGAPREAGHIQPLEGTGRGHQADSDPTRVASSLAVAWLSVACGAAAVELSVLQAPVPAEVQRRPAPSAPPR